MVCSFFKHKECNPARSRIHAERWEDESYLGKTLVRVCQQCIPPFCRSVCPKGAIAFDEKTGATIVDYTLCNKCGLCFRECPFGAIRRDPETGFPLICDLCGGKPNCVEWCPAHAISYITATKTNVNVKRRFSADMLLQVKEANKHRMEG